MNKKSDNYKAEVYGNMPAAVLKEIIIVCLLPKWLMAQIWIAEKVSRFSIRMVSGQIINCILGKITQITWVEFLFVWVVFFFSLCKIIHTQFFSLHACYAFSAKKWMKNGTLDFHVSLHFYNTQTQLNGMLMTLLYHEKCVKCSMDLNFYNSNFELKKWVAFGFGGLVDWLVSSSLMVLLEWIVNSASFADRNQVEPANNFWMLNYKHKAATVWWWT